MHSLRLVGLFGEYFVNSLYFCINILCKHSRNINLSALEVPIKTRVGGTESKQTSLLPSFGTWAGVYSTSVQTGAELRVRCCQGCLQRQNRVLRQEQRISSLLPLLCTSPQTGPLLSSSGM